MEKETDLSLAFDFGERLILDKLPEEQKKAIITNRLNRLFNNLSGQQPTQQKNGELPTQDSH